MQNTDIDYISLKIWKKTVSNVIHVQDDGNF